MKLITEAASECQKHKIIRKVNDTLSNVKHAMQGMAAIRQTYIYPIVKKQHSFVFILIQNTGD